jgi:hypothetical protein
MSLSRIQTTLFSGDISDSVLRSFLVSPAPTGLTATVGNEQVLLSWVAPTVLAQTPITDYTKQYSSNNGTTWTTFTEAASTATSATITGLTNGTAYTFRVAGVNGIGTGAFSTASSAVTPVAGDPLFNSVALRLPFDSDLNDVSLNGITMTVVGGAAVDTTTKRFGAGSLPVGGGKGIYSSYPALGTQDCVIEWWQLFADPGSEKQEILRVGPLDITAGDSTFRWKVKLQRTFATSSFDLHYGNPAGWSHVAIVRESGNWRLYLNGTLIVSKSAGEVNSGSPIDFGGGNFALGGNLSAGGASYAAAAGHFDDLRITANSTRGYTGSTITVPTAALHTRGIYDDPAFERVSLLLPMDGTDSTFTDSSLTPKTITAFGNATQSTAQSKFGGKSAYFDGTGDYISIDDSGNAFAFGTGDFCYEFWFRSAASNPYAALVTRPYGLPGGIFIGLNGASGNGRPEIYWREFENALFIQSDTGGFNDDNWHHFAFARSGTTCRMYIDGVSRGSRTDIGTSVSTSTLIVGTDIEFSGRDFTGYIDDLRITKGSDRGYTGETITVPTAAFPTS